MQLFIQLLVLRVNLSIVYMIDPPSEPVISLYNIDRTMTIDPFLSLPASEVQKCVAVHNKHLTAGLILCILFVTNNIKKMCLIIA